MLEMNPTCDIVSVVFPIVCFDMKIDIQWENNTEFG